MIPFEIIGTPFLEKERRISRKESLEFAYVQSFEKSLP
jgi:hypothetical protein